MNHRTVFVGGSAVQCSSASSAHATDLHSPSHLVRKTCCTVPTRTFNNI